MLYQSMTTPNKNTSVQVFSIIALLYLSVTTTSCAGAFSIPSCTSSSTPALRTTVAHRRISSPHTKLHQSVVTFSSPLIDEGYAPAVEETRTEIVDDKPLLVYLPGFDGTLVAPFLQFPELGTEFEVCGMSVAMEDRSSVDELCSLVMEYIINKTKRKKKKSKELYIMGESFGGILTIEVALAIQNYNSSMEQKGNGADVINLSGLALINPATCYNQSNLAKYGPSVANGSPLLYPFSLMTLVPLFIDNYAFPQLIQILQAKGLPSVIDTPAREAYMGRVAFSLPNKLKFMPQSTLKWRLSEWLTKGCIAIESKEDSIMLMLQQIPVLIVAGEKDNTLPSTDEALRLEKWFDRTVCHVVKGAGHACTSGSRVDLAALMRKTFIPSSSRRKDMKDTASNMMDDVSFGLEPRYDGADIGLNPLKYWSEEYYQKL